MFLSKKMSKPAGIAVELDMRGKPKKPPAKALAGMHDDLGDTDEDETGLHSGGIMPGAHPGAGADDDTGSSMESLYGSDHGDSDDSDSGDDEMDGDDMDGGDSGDDAAPLSPKEMAETTLADATPEQLQAALMQKRKSDASDDSSDGDDMGDDDAGAGSYT